MAFVSSRLQKGAAIALCLIVAACSGEGAAPLEDVGNSSGNLALPLAPIGNGQRQAMSYEAPPLTYQAPAQPVQTAGRGVDYLDTPNLAGVGSRHSPDASSSGLDTGASPSAPSSSPQVQSSASRRDTTEINMDKQFGFSSPASLAGEENLEIAEGNADEPVVDGVGTGKLTAINGSAPTSTSAPDQQVAMLPRAASPLSVPQGGGVQMPISEASCRRELGRLGVRFIDIAPIHDSPQCGIDYPLELQSINNIRILPAAKLNCAMALTFARWVRDDLVPAARLRYFSGVQAIRQLSSYSCRRMDSKASNPWSEHAHGNALDVGTIVLNNGEEVDVRKPGFFNFRQKGLLNTVRADSCRYFSTVLGPGDPYHGNHFHFDLRSRKSGKRYCSLD